MVQQCTRVSGQLIIQMRGEGDAKKQNNEGCDENVGNKVLQNNDNKTIEGRGGILK